MRGPRWAQSPSDSLVHVLQQGSDNPGVLARCGALLPSSLTQHAQRPPGATCPACLQAHHADYRPGIGTWQGVELTEQHRGVLTDLLETLALGVATLARVEREHPAHYRAVEADCWRRVAHVYAQLLAARSESADNPDPPRRRGQDNARTGPGPL